MALDAQRNQLARCEEVVHPHNETSGAGEVLGQQGLISTALRRAGTHSGYFARRHELRLKCERRNFAVTRRMLCRDHPQDTRRAPPLAA